MENFESTTLFPMENKNYYAIDFHAYAIIKALNELHKVFYLNWEILWKKWRKTFIIKHLLFFFIKGAVELRIKNFLTVAYNK